MQDGPVSQGVSRLKELLFEPESQALTDLRRRIDELAESDARLRRELLDRIDVLVAEDQQRRLELARRLAEADAAGLRSQDALLQDVAGLAVREQQERLEIGRRIDALFERAGSAERFQAAVAEVLDGAMRQAEVQHHEKLATAMAPLVVRTIRAEIHNSHDALAEALYPHIGRMVKSYVASAMKDLAEAINRRLEQNALMLRLRSLTTGRPLAELAMADSMKLEVEELYLIRRGTGELVARWPQTAAGGNRDHVLGGTLTAINEFAGEAFAGEASDLRRVDLGAAQIYLRASPLYLLAAKCTGSAPPAIEQVIDAALIGTIEKQGEGDAGDSPATADAPPLAALATDLRSQVAARQAELAPPPLGFAPLKWAVALVLTPLLGWLAWGWYLDYRTGEVRRGAEAAIARVAELDGYRTQIDVERGGRRITVSGLTPSTAVRDAAIAQLAGDLPGIEIRQRFAVLPNPAVEAERAIAELRRNVSGVERQVGDVRQQVGNVGRDAQEAAGTASSARRQVATIEAELARASVRRSLLRAASRLEQALPDIDRLERELAAPSQRSAAARIRGDAAGIAAAMRAQVVALDRATDAPTADAIVPLLAGWSQALAELADQLSSLIDQPTGSQPSAGRHMAGDQPRRDGDGAAAQAEETAAAAERLAAIVVAVQQANALRRSLPPPPAPIVQMREASPRERLAAFARANAVFFDNGTDYRDPAAVVGLLDELVRLLAASDALVRIVGYTDERGGAQRNTSLSQARADKVLEALVERGVGRDRLVAIGRLNSLDLSPVSGTGSSNRRVEFELGFIGERVP